MLQQQPDENILTGGVRTLHQRAHDGQVQRGPALDILRVGVGVQGQQVADNLGGLLKGCQMEGCEAGLEKKWRCL